MRGPAGAWTGARARAPPPRAPPPFGRAAFAGVPLGACRWPEPPETAAITATIAATATSPARARTRQARELWSLDIDMRRLVTTLAAGAPFIAAVGRRSGAAA